MSKASMGLLAGTSLVGAAIPTAYALGGFDGFLSSLEVAELPESFRTPNLAIFGNSWGKKCVGSLFSLDTDTFVVLSSKAQSLSRSSVVVPKGDEIESCVVASIAKVGGAGKDGKWAGDLNLLWAMRKGDDGFVIMGHIPLDEENKKSTTSIFLMEEKFETWSVSYKDKKEEEMDVKKNLPKLNESLLEANSPFNVGEDDLSKLGKRGEIKEESKSSGIYLKWSKEEKTEEQPIGNWSPNLDTWLTSLFSKEAKEVVDKFIKDVKGTWQKQLDNPQMDSSPK